MQNGGRLKLGEQLAAWEKLMQYVLLGDEEAARELLKGVPQMLHEIRRLRARYRRAEALLAARDTRAQTGEVRDDSQGGSVGDDVIAN